MANIHLIRHGHHGLLGTVLCARMPGVELDDLGRRQMNATAELFAGDLPSRLQSSPQRRTMQSADILGARFNLAVEIVPAFDEIDMGQWTGARFANLESDPVWRSWNSKRSCAQPPGGESMAMLQGRVVQHIEQLRESSGVFAIVSHAEPIRAALMHYLKIPLDIFYSIQVDPGSVSTITLEGPRTGVCCVNGEVFV